MIRYPLSLALLAVLTAVCPLLAGAPVLGEADTAGSAGDLIPAAGSVEPAPTSSGAPVAEPLPGETPRITAKKKKIFGVLKECPPDMQYIVVDFNPKNVYEICIDRYEYPNIKDAMPASNVTWYMANKLCKNQGKQLCWDKEWMDACLGLNNWDFSYYNVFDQERCNVQSDSAVKSGSKTQCKTGGYEVYDLVGNLREWTGGGGIGAMGGSFKNGRSARCSRWDELSLQKSYPDVGFRCCAKVNTGRYGKVSKEKLKAGAVAPAAAPVEPAPPATPRTPASPK